MFGVAQYTLCDAKERKGGWGGRWNGSERKHRVRGLLGHRIVSFRGVVGSLVVR
jgi:hypothetical protein